MGTFANDRNRFVHSERLIVELFLLTYIFVFFLGETTTFMPYIWLGISIAGGILAFFIFGNRDFSILLGLAISLAITLPLLLLGAPVFNVAIFFVYAFWRLQSNFGNGRLNGWPFLFLNSIVFIVFYFLSRLILSYGDYLPLMIQQSMIYLLTSFLFFFIRMVTIWITSRMQGNFRAKEAAGVFGAIIGCGAVAFLAVFFGLEKFRLALAGIFGFAFKGVFEMFGKAVAPVLDSIREKAEQKLVPVEESGPVDFEMEKAHTIYGNSSNFFENMTITIAILLLAAFFIYLLWKKRKKRDGEKQPSYTFLRRGKREPVTERVILYDYSAANDEIRKAFKMFETKAQSNGLPRSRGETVPEWFKRMGWGANEVIFKSYDKVRYGSIPSTEHELKQFKHEIHAISEKYFKKDV